MSDAEPLAEYHRQFEADVFVSYAHRDDDRIGREPQGWVSQFHADLAAQIRVYLGADAFVWRDNDVHNNDDFQKKIVHRLARTAMFMPVVSASFLNSEWCMREAKEFAAAAEKNFGMYLDGEKKRIFKVERIPTDRNILPEELQGTTTYKFFVDGKRPLRPYISDLDGLAYYAQLVDLAIDVADTIRRLAAVAGAGGSPAIEAGLTKEHAAGATDKRIVYLAEATYALDDVSAELRRDMKDRGYVVLPEGDLPRRARDYRECVSQLLTRCDVAVHLVGSEYGFVPEGEEKKSNVWIQHELALSHARKGNLKQIVWLSRNGEPGVRQKAFVNYLRADREATAQSETLEGGIEELKTEIYDTFDRLERMRAAAANAVKSAAGTKPEGFAVAPTGDEPCVDADTPLRVYILCERADRQTPEFVAFRRYLISQGLETLLPTVGDSDGETLALHREKLAECDAALIYFGCGAPRWFEVKLNDFRKLLRNRTPPVRAKGVYIAGPSTLEKEEVETNEAIVLHSQDGFSPETMRPFLTKLLSAE